MQEKYCPICLREFKEYPKKCECGFSAFEKQDLSENARLFKVFKFAKDVYFNLVPYEKSKLLTLGGDYIFIDDLENEKRGLEFVDLCGTEKPTCTNEGLLCGRYSTIALILNCDYIDPLVFDESNVKILILGKDVKGFLTGSFKQFSPLKYIYVDEKNTNFETRDNVLIDKRNKAIVAYPNAKTDEEYKVDEEIKHIDGEVFFGQKFLKKLYIPKSIVLNNKSSFGNIQIVRY